MLRIYTSNRAEVLANSLSERLKRDGRHWTEKDTVLVQSKGMERWLNLQLAQSCGIAANIEYPFPKGFMTKVLRASGSLNQDDPFDKTLLTWRVLQLLLEVEEIPEFVALQNYVQDGNSALKRFQLAARIGDLFDQYLYYRPNTILTWTNTDLEPIFYDKLVDVPENLLWQPQLWRLLCEKLNDHEPYIKALHDFCHDEFVVDQSILPQNISLFGISNLPPVVLNFFEKLSSIIDVNIYYLSPCQQFWQDIVSKQRAATLELSDNDEYWEVGNQLLSSMGRLGRDFTMAINNLPNAEQLELYIENDEQNLLEKVQNDILNLVDVKESDEKFILDPADESVQFTSCHSPMREVEVLYDQLLKMFDEDPTLEPHNILVMAPDIQKYAPYITAVFDTPEVTKMALPYCISDRSALQESPIATTFLNMLRLIDLRFTSTEVLDIFENEDVRNKFGVSSDELPIIKQWIHESHICWGIDGEFRRELDVPEFEENSWKFGTDRLLMGYAMGDDADILCGDEILPYEVEGQDAVIIGNFIEFTKQLFRRVYALKTKKLTGKEWAQALHNVVETFFLESRENVSEIKTVHLAISAISNQTYKAEYNEPIDRAIVTTVINDKLSEEGGSSAFLQRGITFCRLLPMRSIPSDVVCILGLNDGEFPRPTKSVGFDLLAKHPMIGDRSMKNDDRYLFLESLLSARKKLYLSYIGQSLKDNTSIPPSVLVDELFDYIDEFCDYSQIGEHIKSSKDHLLQCHPLQSFSPDYFCAETSLFTYSQEAFVGATSLQQPQKNSDEFVDNALAIDLKNSAGEVVIQFDDLVRFFKSPAEYYLKSSLGVNLRRYDDIEFVTTEPFDLPSGGLEGYKNGQELLEKMIEHKDPILQEKQYQRLKAEGRLPIGDAGRTAYTDLFDKVSLQVDKLNDIGLGYREEDISVDLKLNCLVGESPVNVRLEGTLTNIYDDAMMRTRWSNGSVKDKIEAWLNHLVLNCVNEGPDTTVYVVGKDKARANQFTNIKELCNACSEDSTITDAPTLLSNWTSLFIEGQNRPICFFPECSDRYITLMSSKRKDAITYGLEDEARVKAALVGTESDKWLPGFQSRGEVEEPANELCFGKEFPGINRPDEFVSTAELLLKPLNEAISTVKS